MAALVIDTREIAALGTRFARAAKESPKAVMRALNHTGAAANTQVKRSLVQQTGLRAGLVGKALRQKKATPSELQYEIIAYGKHHSLKDFGARRTARGVSAAPWRKRRVFKGTFFGPGGHVFKRTTRARLPIEKLFGPAVPRELVKDQTAAAFTRTVNERLLPRLEHELARMLKLGR